jgi:tRNA modification GTPase
MINTDTICALSTPAGSGAIAVIRMSGRTAFAICDELLRFPDPDKTLSTQQANTLHIGSIFVKNSLLDEVVVGIFRGPRSYTGEDLVEISCHGSNYIQQKILESLIAAGARLAKPGEFTQRAFLNGKMDLSQAEGVADLIASASEASHRIAISQMRGGFSESIRKLRAELLQFISLIELELDFSEEDVEFADRKRLTDLLGRIKHMISSLLSSFEYGNVIKNGVPVAIIGRTNSGKSTLLNKLVRDEKAIVSEIAGTTRDFIEDSIFIQGIQFRFIDTAGLRSTEDTIEKEGILRTYQKYSQAVLVILLVDATDDPEAVDESLRFLETEPAEKKQLILTINKTDLLSEEECRKLEAYYNERWAGRAKLLSISAKNGTHIGKLEELLASSALKNTQPEAGIVVTNIRHYEALTMSSQALERAETGLRNSLPTDLLALDIREILHYLGEITGEITTDEILGNIFKNFCIGK